MPLCSPLVWVTASRLCLRRDWQSPRAQTIRREGKFELARLLTLTSPAQAEEILRTEFEELDRQINQPV
eukprot:COSAG05_NODE_14117_length_407_cov_1.168831_2_plen_68_part_01